MLKHLLIAAVSAGTFLMAGSGFATVAVSHLHYNGAPTYCYDCHSRPVWHRNYSRCGYYSIKVVAGGYYYRPFRHARHEGYRFERHNFFNNKVIRTRR